MALISKQELEHLAELARIELHEHEKEKLLKDLEKILAHFAELKAVNTEGVIPVTGGTELKNVFREDELCEDRFSPDRSVDAFPEKEGRHLKVPPVFE
jgi:aspartyl-tRNA(Asn)/glutamyl-tRNA(Gln) amidotransferase subunit C